MKKFLMSLGALAALVLAPNLASAQTTVAISLVHGVPGVTVDVSVDGAVIINNFAPGSIADISSFAGSTLTNVEVIDDATQATIIGPIASLPIPASGNVSFVAYLDGNGNPMLGKFDNNVAEVGAGQTRLTVRHTAAAQPVDLVIGDTRPITDLANGDSQELTLPAGNLADASIAPTGGDPLVDIPVVNMAADTNNIIYVVGSAAEDTIDFVVQVVQLPSSASTTTTTTVAGSTTTTVAGSTTTTTTIAGQTTTTTSTTTTVAPVKVNTGSPIDGSRTTYLLIAVVGGLAIAGISFAARRRV